MNWDRIQGNIRQVKGRLLRRLDRIKAEEGSTLGGRYRRFVGRLQERYGIAKQRAERRIDRWLGKR
jgi:uncharacterized protein YjbJ (UPF0337 family)